MAARTVDEVAHGVLEHAAALPDVVRAAVALSAAGGRELRFAARLHGGEQVGAVDWCLVDGSDDLPLPRTVITGVPGWFPTLEDLAASYPTLAQHEAEFGTDAFATVPLRAHEAVGALMLCFGRPHRFDAEEQAFLDAFASLAAHALSRVMAEPDHDAADVLQRWLLPARLPELPGLALAGHYQGAGTAAGVGGDWYDVVPLADGSVLFAVGDVLGRGDTAASVAGYVRAAVHAYAQLDPTLETLLARLDQLTAGQDQATTLLVGLVDRDRATLQVACAGHLPLVVADPGTDAMVVETTPGPPLGLTTATREATAVPLQPGTIIVACTDGLVESRRLTTDKGLTQLAEHLDVLTATTRLPDELCRHLVESTADRVTDDDSVLLVLANTVGRPTRNASTELFADSRAAGQGRRWLAELLRRWDVPESVSGDALLCLSEVVTNAIIHTHTGPRVNVALDGSRLLVTVTDQGRRPGAHPPDATQPGDADTAIRGRGLQLVDAFTHAWGSGRRADGTTVWLEFSIPDQQSGPTDRGDQRRPRVDELPGSRIVKRG